MLWECQQRCKWWRGDSQSAVGCHITFNQTADMAAKELEIGSRELASDSWWGDVRNLAQATFKEANAQRG